MDRRRVFLTALCFLAVATWSVVVVLGIVLRRDVFHWDESSYAFRAVTLSGDLERGDVLTFLRRWTSDEYMTFGAVHAYLLAPILVVFGPSFGVARTFSVLLMAGTGIGAFVICSAIAGRRGALAGVLAVAVLLASPEMINWYTSNMLEPLAAFLTVVSVALYVLSRGSPHPWRQCLTGIVLAALFFTKHNYGVLAIAGIALDGLVSLALAALRRRGGDLRQELWSYALLACSVALPVLIWLRAASIPRVYATIHWELIDQFAWMEPVNRPYLDRLADTLTMLRSAYFASSALGWYVIVASLLFVIVIGERRLRALGLIAGAGLLLIPTSQFVQSRYLVATMPLMVVVAALVPLSMFRRSAYHRVAAVLLLAGLTTGLVASTGEFVALPDRVVAAAAPVPGYVWRNASDADHAMNLVDVTQFVRDSVPREHSVAVMVRSGFLSPYLWKFIFHDRTSTVWTSNEFDDPRMPAADYFVALDFGGSSPYASDIEVENRGTNIKLWSTYLTAREHEGSLTLDAERDFPTIATKVRIYLHAGTTNVPLPAFLPPMKL